MIKQFIQFQGHKCFKDIFHLHSTIKLKAAVANHVSANSFTSLIPPQSVADHSHMCSADKAIWDAAYTKEQCDLNHQSTWDTISDAQFQTPHHKVNPVLPSMTISTIKKDALCKHKQAKYHIAAPENLDPLYWNQNKIFAPVIIC